MGNLCSSCQTADEKEEPRAVPVESTKRSAPNGHAPQSVDELINWLSSNDDTAREKALAHVAEILAGGNNSLAVDLASRGLYQHLAASLGSEHRHEVLPALKATWHLAKNADTHEAASKSTIARALMSKLTSESNGQKASAAKSLQDLVHYPKMQTAVAENGKLYAILVPGLRAAETEPVQREFSELLVDAARFPTASQEFATE